MPKAKKSYETYSYEPYSYESSSAYSLGGATSSYAGSYSATLASTSYGSSRLLAALDGVEEPISQQLKPKKQRKKKDPDAPQVEKRGARFKTSCPQATRERAGRLITQRFYVVDRIRSELELKEEFKILGSTGNVYTVTIDKNPRCDCPDATKGNHCKHIVFIFLKVLQVPRGSTSWYQKALLSSELEEVFRDAPAAPGSLATAQVRDAYAKATGKASSSKAGNGDDQGVKKRVPGPEDDCPICYESMHNCPEKKLSYCETCGNCLHKDCFQQWAKTAKNLTCVWCRAPWANTNAANPARAASGSATVSEGYLNLSGAAGVSPVRDTSSYYHGPRRGQRYYGYQDYEDDWRM